MSRGCAAFAALLLEKAGRVAQSGTPRFFAALGAV